jgi:hypothetical protein
MRTPKRTPAVLISSTAILMLILGLSAIRAQTPAAAGTKIWLENPAKYEDYIKSADVVGIEEIKVGVTKPRKATLTPGGLVEAIAFKAIAPGRYGGFWESYKSEIAAYELDKMLGLGMIPPTVEKRVKGDLGAAVMWISPTKSFKDLGGVPGQAGIAGPTGAKIPTWSKQLTRAKMFDNLIANIDPNLGNWLVDPDWNLILIDHTRAFTASKDLFHKIQNVDDELWEKMKALDEASLTDRLGKLVGKGEIRAVLQRRDKMQQEFDKLKKS